MPAMSGISLQGEEETKRHVIQTMQTESPKKSLLPIDAESVSAGLNRSYFQQGFALTESNRLSGINPEILKDDIIVKTEVRQDDLKSVNTDVSADLSSTQNWLESTDNSKWPSSCIDALSADSEKPIDSLSLPYVVRSDRLESTGLAKSALQPNEQGEVVKNSENYSDGPVQKSCVPKESNFSSVKKSYQCTTMPIVSADLPPQESKEEALDKDTPRHVGTVGACEACKWKESSDPDLPTFAKILSPCRNCDPREILCDAGHTQAPAAFSGDLIPRPCRGFDRQGPRRIPVANVQPFMKEPVDAVLFKPSVDPVPPTLEDVQKSEDAQTDASSAVIDDATAKAALASGALKLDNQTVGGWTSGDTPHLKEFVKFLEISAANPYRTPDEKLRETLGPGANESTDCDDRGRVKRQLLLHLAGPKGRPKPTPDAKREGGLVVGCDSKKTPVEYIDEDNCIEPVKGKEKAAGETRDPMGRTSTAENDDSLYGASALYQTMKALDRQAEDRFKASLLAKNAAAFSVSKTAFERKAQTSDEGATYGLNRASDRPTSDVTLEQRKKKKQKQKATNMDASAEQLETKQNDVTTSTIFEQRARDAQKELASSVSSATDETAASEAGDSYAASTSALDESASSSKPPMKRKYQRKKTKQEELPGANEGNQLTTELTGNKSSTTSMVITGYKRYIFRSVATQREGTGNNKEATGQVINRNKGRNLMAFGLHDTKERTEP